MRLRSRRAGQRSRVVLVFGAKNPAETPHVHLGRIGEVDAPRLLATGMSNQPWFVPGDDSFVFHSNGSEGSAVFLQRLTPVSPAQRIGPVDTGTPYVAP